jgi:hypothetical protein
MRHGRGPAHEGHGGHEARCLLADGRRLNRDNRRTLAALFAARDRPTAAARERANHGGILFANHLAHAGARHHDRRRVAVPVTRRSPADPSSKRRPPRHGVARAVPSPCARSRRTLSTRALPAARAVTRYTRSQKRAGERQELRRVAYPDDRKNDGAVVSPKCPGDGARAPAPSGEGPCGDPRTRPGRRVRYGAPRLGCARRCVWVARTFLSAPTGKIGGTKSAAPAATLWISGGEIEQAAGADPQVSPRAGVLDVVGQLSERFKGRALATATPRPGARGGEKMETRAP